MQWYESIENLKNLAYFIQERIGVELSAAIFLEKPWHYENEWNEYQKQCYQHSHDQQEMEMKV